MGSTNLAYSRLSFQGLPLFLGKEKTSKCIYFAAGHCFIHPPLFFATQSLITSLQHIKLCISLQVYEHSVLPNVMKDPLLIVRIILRRSSIKTLILSDLRRCKFLKRWVITVHLHIPNRLCNVFVVDLVCYFKIWQILFYKKL